MRDLLIGLMFVVIATGCPTPQDRCAPACAGCCDAMGTCQAGQGNSACGASGVACTACGSGLQCSAGVCNLTTAGGGIGATGGGTATGGGAPATGGGLATGGGNPVGGGTTSSRSDELTAGTRLKVRSMVGADGSRQQVGFYDSMRMEGCSFLPAADGTQRCLPYNAPAAHGQYFEDSGCSQPVFEAIDAACVVQPKYGVIFSPTCPRTWTFYSVSLITPTPTQLFTGSPSSCRTTGSLTPGYTYHRSTGLLPPSDFVQGDYVVEP